MSVVQRILTGLGAAAVFMLSGCIDVDLGGISDRYREDFHYSYSLNPGATIQLESFNGSVEITGWDKDLVEIDGTKYAASEMRMKDIKIDISDSPNSLSIRTSHPMEHFGNAGARFTLHVPKRVDLTNISTSNGPVRINTIEGSAHVHTSNGSIHASGLKGSLDAQTSNGTVDLSDVSGDTTVRTSNGSVKAEVRKGHFDAHTSNGSITARLLEADSHPVRLESSNGHIELTLDEAREVHATTSNSSITIRMPATINATVNAHTSNASITSDFDVSVHGGRIGKHSLEGNIGEGGPTLDLGTSNGSIKLVRF